MPDFYVDVVGSPALDNRVWEDPASASLPSRLTNLNDRQYRRLVAQRGTQLTISAILQSRAVVEPDTTVGLFTMWPIEWPDANGKPMQLQPTAGVSAVQRFTLAQAGHYTFGIRHENTLDAPDAAAGGVLVYHVDVEGS